MSSFLWSMVILNTRSCQGNDFFSFGVLRVILNLSFESVDSLLRTSGADRVLILQYSGLKLWLPCVFVLRESNVKYFREPILFVNFIRPFARWRHFTTTTRVLQGFAFLCKLGLLLTSLGFLMKFLKLKEKRKGSWL